MTNITYSTIKTLSSQRDALISICEQTRECVYGDWEAASVRSGQGLFVYNALPGHSAQV